MKLTATFCLMLVVPVLFAQNYQRQYDIPVTQDNETLVNPWAGGLNSCQISRIDVNLDGKKDLFVFDRIGSRINIYLNMDDTPGAMNYKYTLEYNDQFPTNLRNWVLLRDMNCDGKEDICGNTGSGFRIYWNISSDELEFSAPTTTVQAYYDFGSSPFTNTVYCIAPDVPAIHDYDGDGDMDFYSWNEYSTSLYFYKNMAVENGDCTTPDFICRNRCYGQFGEGTESFSLSLGEAFICDFNVVNPRESSSGPMRHTGGTLLAIDLDQDDMRDLIIGDVTENYLAAVMIDESVSGVDSATFYHSDFPATFQNTLPATLRTFPAPFYEDVNNDGVGDLIVGVNTFTDGEDRRSLLLFLNEGEDNLPQFTYIQDNFLQDGQIDLGLSAYPVVFDLNNDGLKDLLVPNRRYFEFGNNFTSKIWYYRNTGTATSPAFTLADDNWMNIPSLEWQNVYPTFGDLDGDEDDDMIIGNLEGELYYFQNVAAAGAPANFVMSPTAIVDADNVLLDVGQNVTPQIMDMDDDGLNDLVIGELNGNINYYRNTGSATAYEFTHMADTLGDVVATSLLGIQGKAVPFFFRNANNELELLLGTETGQINHYNNISGNLNGAFNLVTEDYENIREGERSAVFLSDLNHDNIDDLLVGNVGGGLGIYFHLPVDVTVHHGMDQLKVYPNPAQGFFRLELNSAMTWPAMMEVFDCTGRLVMQKMITAKQQTIPCEHLQAGTYILRLRSGDITASAPLILK
ncbi:MAG: T9SS type A sorting domain-containing protein [Flavobacteriales bacterium]|nr:T9SS type A sorting domain-containing protein [Flavobacteriales bacterium]